MSGDAYSLSNPTYWLIGLAIFGAGLWMGRAVALRLVPPSSWRTVAGVALIFGGVLAIPSPNKQQPVQQPRPVQQPAALPSRGGGVPQKVIVASDNLPAQTVLTLDNVETTRVPADTLRRDATTSLSDVLGKVLTVPVAAGQQILTPLLEKPPPDPPRCAHGLATILTRTANIRSGANIATSVIEQVKYGTELPIYSQANDAWFKVRLPDQREGWVETGWVTLQCAEIVDAEITPPNPKVGDTLNIQVTVSNTSPDKPDRVLQSTGPDPGFAYIQGQTYSTLQFKSQPGKWRVAIGSSSLDASELPYRWGLGGDLTSGSTTTISGRIKITQDFKATYFWAALVREPSTIVQAGMGMTLITALPANVPMPGALR